MAARIPPLKALRAFEAAARHVSIKRASEELNVTPGAISQLVKALEFHLGVPLFRRMNRGLVLTEAGQRYLLPIRAAFRQIAEASQVIAASRQSGILTVSVTPSFAASWLVPRLKRFHEQHSDIDLRLQTGKALVDFSHSDVDLAIRHGLGRYPGLRSDRLVSIELIPVASAALIKKYGMPKSSRDLIDWPLLHDSERRDWQLWLETQGVADHAPLRGPSFEDSALVLQASESDQGAALIPATMAAASIEEGRLVRLLQTSWPMEFAYYLVYPIETTNHPKIAAFRNWILCEASGVGSTENSSAVSGSNTRQ